MTRSVRKSWIQDYGKYCDFGLVPPF